MVLYTIVPPEQVMSQPEEAPAYEYRTVHNSLVEGTAANGRFTVHRLISTDPGMYLDRRYAPGCRWGPQE